ncbi:hypothetical protein B0J12DRAFT_699523 [Macrophomina phaseolina]|uniref:Uncharacterized protein n=1 Tax=Macrophomina phaseolina TaxID=35725 RepID=A0ABQ8GAI4_9PEZI|nr:hypothetical protein B0J12DRAFT_699523 [Macrophomina phaseolina]
MSTLRPNIWGEYSILLEGRDDDLDHVDLHRSRWRTRAWVWQEEAISTRQLIFGEKIVEFRCNEGIKLEYGVSKYLHEMALHRSPDYQGFWTKALTEFSSRDMAFSQDRLGAISGVARFIDESLKKAGKRVEYLAGLWA